METNENNDTNRRPRVSVLMLAYDQEKFVAQAIESVLCQKTSFPFEIVLGEDCSHDRTAEICEGYAKRFPGIMRLIRNEKNLGLIGNFMNAYAQCRGEYVAICEADDFWCSPHKLQRQVEFLDAHPDYSIAIHRVVNDYADRNVWSLSNGGTPVHTALIDLARSNYISNVSALFRRIPAEELPEWFGKVSTYDYPLHVLNAMRGKIYYDKRPMAVYRQHGGVIWSQAPAENKLRMSLSVRELLIDHMKMCGYDEAASIMTEAHKAIARGLERKPDSPAPRRKLSKRILTGARETFTRIVPYRFFFCTEKPNLPIISPRP